MKRIWFLAGLLIAVMLVGAALAQGLPDEEEEEIPPVDFVIESEIGRALPRSMIYDPVNERMAVIDAYNRLLIVDATTFETMHVLYENGGYHDIAFSNDGQWLGLAIDSRIELYNTETGELVADLVDLGQAISIVGPLAFSRDDNLLQFEGIYPAPRSIRISENDTIRVPWLWNLTAARNEGTSTFPRQVEAWQFFDYRNGFVIGPENRIVAALPGRLQVLDAYSLEMLFEIPTDRYERDPLNVWFSARDRKIYVRPVNTDTLLQVDTERGVLVEIPFGIAVTPDDLELVGGIELSDQARVIGEPNSSQEVDLLEIILGRDYMDSDRFGRPLTITLIDLIIPPASTGDNIAALMLVFNEREQTGLFVLSRVRSNEQMVLSPDENLLIVRRNDDGNEQIVTYDLNTGEELRRFIPSLRAIGSYSRINKNRVLAYNGAEDVIVSDFQRYDAETNEVILEDLRYSRRFERFFFTDDSAGIVTLSGTEWRLWNANTGVVQRREVLDLRGSIFGTSRDGFRFLTRYDDRRGNGVEVTDLNDNTRRNVDFVELPARDIIDVIPRSDWQKFFVIYGQNPWGQYHPGNEIAMYDLDEGLLWLIAGDDLPPAENRQYGWVNDETVYVYGNGNIDGQPARIFGNEADLSGLPACAVEAFPDQIEIWADLWERLVYNLRPDKLAALSISICENLPETADGVAELLVPTATPALVAPTPVLIEGVPSCLTAEYPGQAEEYAAVWFEMTNGLTDAEIADVTTLLCEGLGPTPQPRYSEPIVYAEITMMIDADTGERATGSFTPIERVTRPIGPIQEAFEESEDRPLGQAVLAPNEELVAASNLPGELVIYRMIYLEGSEPAYEFMINNITATAIENLERQNLIQAQPSLTPTFDAVGTARPTLTPTVTPTPIPRPEEQVYDGLEVVELCPVEELYTLDNLPDSYDPPGRIVGPVQGDFLWTINPLTAQRAPDETIPQCTQGITCNFSPNREWILATSFDEMFVIRPDGSDERLLFGEDDLWPPDVYWSGNGTLEYMVTLELEDEHGNIYYRDAYQKDILGVFPDPEPWIPEISINELPTDILARQPGGSLLLARTTFSTGIGPGYKYYIYDIETGEYEYFARVTDYPVAGELSAGWHPTGDRLFYYYPTRSNQRIVWYQIDTEDNSNLRLGTFYGGLWSNDGRYRVFATDSRTQPVAVWDSETGYTRTYCVPETGSRYYDGSFTWSPDGNYVALHTYLPADENEEGVGRHTLILNVETGEIVDLTTGIVEIVDWSRDAGTYGDGE